MLRFLEFVFPTGLYHHFTELQIFSFRFLMFCSIIFNTHFKEVRSVLPVRRFLSLVLALLIPFAAARFIEATKRQQIYLDPGKFECYTEEDWNDRDKQKAIFNAPDDQVPKLEK